MWTIGGFIVVTETGRYAGKQTNFPFSAQFQQSEQPTPQQVHDEARNIFQQLVAIIAASDPRREQELANIATINTTFATFHF
jgi:hypothetical protein